MTASPRIDAEGGGRGRGRPPRSQSERAAQRTRLLDGAMAAVRRIGPEVSVDQLAAEAGVSKPVLYDEFGDKDGIADAIAVEIARRAEQRFIASLTGGGALDLSSGTRAAVEALIDLVTDEPNLYKFLVRCIRSSDRGLLDNGLVRALDSRVKMFTTLLAPGASPELLVVLAHGTFGFVFAAVESWHAAQAPSREELVDSLVTIILHGFHALGGSP